MIVRKNIPVHFFRIFPLFGIFPSGMPGLGLFLLRVITALTLGYTGYCIQGESAASWSAANQFGVARLVSMLLMLVGVLMILGIATMISGILSCALLLISFASLHSQTNAQTNGFLPIAAGLSLVLTLMGPGAYSLDARFFGWRRVEIARPTPKPKT
jgi:uncharacterized membrane protein YphA (DoxX/SURF4 family)